MSRLLFTSADGTELFSTDGTTVTLLADGSSSPAFLPDPIYDEDSVISAGGATFITMADTADATSAIWLYDGSALTQITASSEYVYARQDFNNPVNPLPETSFNGMLVFSQESLAANANTDDQFDQARLATYNPANGSLLQYNASNGGFDPHDFVTMGSTLYYEATDTSTNAQAIYSFDGTSITEIYNQDPTFTFDLEQGFGPETVPAAGAVTGPLIAFNNNLYFGSGQETVEELTALTSLSNSASNVGGGAEYDFNPLPGSDLVVANNHLFFLSNNNGIYSLDTNNNLTLVVPSEGAQEFNPVVFNGAVYFTALNDPTFTIDLFTSTGGAATDIASNFNGTNFQVMGNTLYYNNESQTTLGTIDTSNNIGTVAVPGDVGGIPLGVVPSASAWTAASDPITITAGATTTYHSGGAAVTVDPGVTVADTAAPTLESATIAITANFVTGDTLNFVDQSGITGGYDATTGVLTLSGFASVANYQTALDSITYSFSGADATNGGDDPDRTVAWAIGDGINNSLAAHSTIDEIACYCRGTLIETSDGEVAVETLAIGDRLLTMSGALRPIKWIGRRSYGGRFIVGREDILPIRIKAGALDDNVPLRDLWISPHHAMYLNGVLIEARDLVNGCSIVQAEQVETVEYFHIELETHDVIVAEGALSETFVDDDSRDMFHNAHEYRELHPEATSVPARYCAARPRHGYEVEAVRQEIARRAGLRTPDDQPRVSEMRGYVDRINSECIAGWAQNVDHPEAQVCLDIFVGGRLIGQTLANRYREDLARPDIGSGHHGFEFRLPVGLSLVPEAVRVRRSLDGSALDVAGDVWRQIKVSDFRPASRRKAA
ncbi:MAG: Hint domain-containing protein [Bradyrhizobium sp.]